MKSKNIDREVEELNSKFKQLELKYNNLRDQYTRENVTLTERVLQLEENNRLQERKISILKATRSEPKQSDSSDRSANSQHILTKKSFKQGDLVRVTNNYKGQFGAIGKVYSVTNSQVHFSDIRTGISLTRAFKNVSIFHLSAKERNNLLQK